MAADSAVPNPSSNPPVAEPSGAVPALEVIALRKTYSSGVQALKGVSLKVAQGDFFALLGPNGAGKSTLIGILSSLVNPTGGDAHVFGLSIHADRGGVMRQIGLVPQEINFNQFETPFDICVNVAGFYGIPRIVAKPRAEKYRRERRIWDKAFQPTRMMSGGMKRRLMIARAMMNEPRLLILDEPTAGVDIEIRRSMWEFLRNINAEGTTIILTTHYLEEAETLCRNIAIIDGGRIAERDRMSSLLRRLHSEVFVLNLRDALDEAPRLEGYPVTLVDSHTIEVEVSKERTLNDIFLRLSELGIEVLSMRNKVNRLEEIFMRLVEGTGARSAERQRQSSAAMASSGEGAPRLRQGSR